MNTTPDFEKVGLTVPLEKQSVVRFLAVVRLCVVMLAIYVCVLQLMRLGFWSVMADRALIFVGVLSGLGLYVDAIEVTWRRLGLRGRFTALVLAIVVTLGSMASSGSMVWNAIAMASLILPLVVMAHGLLQISIDPLRAARFRQMKRYLRTLPADEKPLMRKRLEKNFETLIAEGFH